MGDQVKVFLINLDKSTDRLAACVDRLQQYNVEFERISAVYGADLSDQEVAQHYDQSLNERKFFRPLAAGEIGCYMSHRKAWQKIIDEDLDYAVILEDDFNVEQDLNHVFSLLDTITKEWDHIKLSALKSRSRKVRAKKPVDDQFEIVLHNKVFAGTCAQVVTKQGAKQLLVATNKFGRPIDIDLQYIWETAVPTVSLMPFAFSQDLDFESDIDVSRSKMRKGKLKKIKLQVVDKVNNYLHTSKLVKRFT